MTEKLDQVREEFETFREECVNLAILINTFNSLFEPPDSRGDYSKVSPQFFSDLNGWMIELYYLKVFRLLDKSKARGQENLTANLLSDRLRELSKLTPKISELLERLNCYKSMIQGARHKLVAHIDRHAIQDAKPLGGHDEACAKLFRKDLQRFCDAVAEAVGAEPTDFINIPPGDVADMKRVLRAHLREKKEK